MIDEVDSAAGQKVNTDKPTPHTKITKRGRI